MCSRSVTPGLLVLALATSASAAPLAGDPSPTSASAPTGAPPTSAAPAPGNASTAGKSRPTAAQLEQLGAVSVASPNQRNTGTTFASPDPAIFGRINLRPQAKPLEEPPGLHVAPGEAAKSGGAGNMVAPPQAPN